MPLCQSDVGFFLQEHPAMVQRLPLEGSPKVKALFVVSNPDGNSNPDSRIIAFVWLHSKYARGCTPHVLMGSIHGHKLDARL